MKKLNKIPGTKKGLPGLRSHIKRLSSMIDEFEAGNKAAEEAYGKSEAIESRWDTIAILRQIEADLEASVSDNEKALKALMYIKNAILNKGAKLDDVKNIIDGATHE